MLWLRLFCLLGLPMFVINVVLLPTSLWSWPHRRDGVQEGPEPTDTEMVLSLVAFAGFELAYAFAAWSLCAWGSPPRSLRLSLVLPIVPLLLWMGVHLSTNPDPAPDRLWMLLYPSLLVLTLVAGVVTVSRHRDSGQSPWT